MKINDNWMFKRAKFPQDGEYDFAILATVDGTTQCIAEVFGRTAEQSRPNAGGTAERLVACVNACAALKDPSVVPEMLAAIKFVLEDRLLVGGSNLSLDAHDVLNRAIAKAEAR